MVMHQGVIVSLTSSSSSSGECVGVTGEGGGATVGAPGIGVNTGAGTGAGGAGGASGATAGCGAPQAVIEE
jgi:hypothetical protein